MTTTPKPQGWHIINWGVLGWVETAFKVAAIIAALLAFGATGAASDFQIVGNPRLFSVIILALATLATIAQIGLRLQLKDIIALAFAVAYFIGHSALLIALLRAPAIAQGYGIAFAVLILAGDVVKFRWLTVSGYTEAGVPTSGLFKLVYAVLSIYTLFLLGLLIG
ncbi:MAG: hypothetical protein MUF38_14640 [Anaerolineae bacterium]|nr:hypothetical protein [Anaerolineae bacterium]